MRPEPVVISRLGRWFAVVIVCLLGESCAIGLGPRVPELLVGQPSPGDEIDREVMAARVHRERGDAGLALALVLEILQRHPRHVDAHRLRQDLLRQRGRLGLLRVEAEQRIDAWQDSAEAHYLMGRIAATDRLRARHFQTALDRNPSSFWAWLGLAYSQRQLNPAYAVTLYERLYAVSDQHPLIALAYASSLRGQRRLDAAMEIYRKLATHADYRGQAELGKARTLYAQEREDESWLALLQALRARPYDAGVQQLLVAHLGHGLSPNRIEQVVQVIWEDPESMGLMLRNGGAALLSGLMQRSGQLQGALAAITGHEAVSRSAVFRRYRRRMLLASGDIAGYLRDLGDSLPMFLIDDERNRIRGRWVALLEISWDDAIRDHDAIAYESLISALVDAGLLLEADIVASMAVIRCREESGRVVSLQTDLRRELAFEGAVRRLIYRGYAAAHSPSLAQVIEEIRRLSRQVLGRDVVGDPEIFQVPMVGSLVNPFTDGLGRYFASHNKHLVLGQRYGGAVEGLLLTRLSVRSLERNVDLPLPSQCLQVVGINREIQVQNGVFGGDLAGIALLNHYVIDMDAVQDWTANLRNQRAVVSADNLALLDDPIPEASDQLDPVDVAWRLPLLSPVADDRLLPAVFEMISWHERAHLVDSFYYLPPIANLFRVLSLMVAHGFDPLSIESEMEGRAEAAALAFSEPTRLVLAHIASFLDAAPGSTHGIGFRRLAEQINRNLGKERSLRQNARASRWHLVDPQRMRDIARKLCRDYR